MDLNFSIVVLISTFAITLAQYNPHPQQYRQIPNNGPHPQQYRQISNNGPQLNYAPPSPPKQLAYPSFQSSYTSDYKKPVTPSPIILSHRQSLTHDGGFKYAFAADNGLQQGETISPDGTRQGQYSYVDPSGQQITVKYSAGKEGFRILEGAHVPQPTEAQQIQKPQTYQPYQPQPSPIPIRYNSAPQIFAASNDKYTQAYQQHQPIPQPQIPRYLQYKSPSNIETRENTIQQEPEYNDEPGKPHSFGNGYSFEFSG